ncbi:succinyl-diaminopimelate desuccinylase [Nakamurella flavida]|uniref:Succinyl-diaminopimelate desuccinylase n=1 Tax=Nakamurella flavida TaxID=363630 RepID=A0A939C686_9ACTN|nr:succinyl-diaminopimelate desuccinylase [Nakamurella flavida]MBM9476957.1 succinyl-diaminopimelate desuccinylase [Nakamurella flavida]MDP9779902.1 succinyl-diaminopimelate desuccinylase [Nakamurella flavida]
MTDPEISAPRPVPGDSGTSGTGTAATDVTTQRYDLDLRSDPADLTAALVDIPSVSGTEQPLADAIERALRALPHLEVVRLGNSVLARTQLGRPTRIMLAGHIDTVPIADNVPSRRDGDILHGCGTTDMKSGDAMLLHLAATLFDDGAEPARDLTFVFYDCEEIEHERNGLTAIEAQLPEWLDADLAVLGEPTDGKVEAGCQGTLSMAVTVHGRRAHAARSWRGSNAIHRAAAVLDTLAAFDARVVEIDGCTYREGLNAVGITGGVASNVIPDECEIRVNFRFAPDRSAQSAVEVITGLLSDDGPLDPSVRANEVRVLDVAAGALPGLSAPAAAEFVAAAGGEAVAKFGWTDVARFAARGVPAVNFGPGDPSLAHTREEHVSRTQIQRMTQVLRRFLA